VGGTVLWNDTGLPAQHPHNVGDGRIVRVGRTAPGSDSQAVSEGRRGGDSPLTWVGGVGTAPQVEGDLERDGASREGLGPSSEAGTRPRGRLALERGGGFVMRRLPLERGGGLLEGRRGRLFVGPLRFFGPWAFLDFGLRPCGA
jgi:hypothetical protein